MSDAERLTPAKTRKDDQRSRVWAALSRTQNESGTQMSSLAWDLGLNGSPILDSRDVESDPPIIIQGAAECDWLIS
jgi:hypothetical protein